MAHHKDNEEMKRPPVVVLPPLPRITPPPKPVSNTTIEPFAKEVEEILYQLKNSDILKDRESYDLLLSYLKRDFPVTTEKSTTRSFTPLLL